MKRKNKISKNQKIKCWAFWLIPLISLLILAFFIISIPLDPIQQSNLSDTIITLRWIGFAQKAFVDDNKDFSSPIIVEKNNQVVFESGTYYWKTSSICPLSVFTVDSFVAVEVEDKEDTKKIKNAGSVSILLEIFNKFTLTGKIILNKNESYVVDNSGDDTKIVVSQYDKQDEN